MDLGGGGGLPPLLWTSKEKCNIPVIGVFCDTCGILIYINSRSVSLLDGENEANLSDLIVPPVPSSHSEGVEPEAKRARPS
jgi:hypothetical protein